MRFCISVSVPDCAIEAATGMTANQFKDTVDLDVLYKAFNSSREMMRSEAALFLRDLTFGKPTLTVE